MRAFPDPTDDLLAGRTVVALGVNVPIGEAGRRLAELGAAVTKVEPPAGDPLELAAAAWYRSFVAGLTVTRLDLKAPAGRGSLDALLARSQLLVTSFRPSALERLGLGAADLAQRFPHLDHVAIVGRAHPEQESPGHDLTYVASCGLVEPPALPRTLIADLAGAERAVSTALALLLSRAAGRDARSVEVALEGAAQVLAEPFRHGLTAPGGLLGGGTPVYGLYETREGWVAVAALESHFAVRLLAALGLPETATHAELGSAFLTRPAPAWEAWATEHDLPLVAVRQNVDERMVNDAVSRRQTR